MKNHYLSNSFCICGPEIPQQHYWSNHSRTWSRTLFRFIRSDLFAISLDKRDGCKMRLRRKLCVKDMRELSQWFIIYTLASGVTYFLISRSELFTFCENSGKIISKSFIYSPIRCWMQFRQCIKNMFIVITWFELPQLLHIFYLFSYFSIDLSSPDF